MVKKSILALALAGVSAFASAAGAYDGVYQALGRPGYLVIMQNGTTLGAASLGSVTNSAAVGLGSAQAGYVKPPQINAWEVYTGTIAGSTATVVGVSDFGACTTTSRATFDGAGNLTVQNLSSTPTALGISSGYNCLATGSGVAVNLQRVF